MITGGEGTLKIKPESQIQVAGRWEVQVRQEIENEQMGAQEGINDLFGYFDWVAEVKCTQLFEP